MEKFKLFGMTAFACATIFLLTQCDSRETQAYVAPSATTSVSTTEKGLNVAFVDIDSLFTNYNLSVTMNKEMLRKEENMRMTLSEKAKVIQADYEDFQRKLANNVYATRERAEEEQNRIMKAQEKYNQLSERLAGELAAEGQKNNVILRDSINSFLKDYNAIHGYDLIISRLGDNLLYADKSLDITNEVIDGLNKRYAASEE